jgi:hypothetical protein
VGDSGTNPGIRPPTATPYWQPQDQCLLGPQEAGLASGMVPLNCPVSLHQNATHSPPCPFSLVPGGRRWPVLSPGVPAVPLEVVKLAHKEDSQDMCDPWPQCKAMQLPALPASRVPGRGDRKTRQEGVPQGHGTANQGAASRCMA